MYLSREVNEIYASKIIYLVGSPNRNVGVFEGLILEDPTWEGTGVRTHRSPTSVELPGFVVYIWRDTYTCNFEHMFLGRWLLYEP